MNIITINKNSLVLDDEQNKKCDTKCLGYINTSDIGVTTCGTRIECDNVFPQRHPVKMKELNGSITEVHGMILNQPIIATASTSAMRKQHLFDFCDKKQHSSDGSIEWSECKHIKLLLASHNIIIAKSS